MESWIQKNASVEVRDDKKFRWLHATVKKVNKVGTVKVEFHTVLELDNSPVRVKTVDGNNVRPTPPVDHHIFAVGEKVDAYHEEAWYEGKVLKVGNGNITIRLKFSKETLKFNKNDVRIQATWLEEVQWLNGGNH